MACPTRNGMLPSFTRRLSGMSGSVISSAWAEGTETVKATARAAALARGQVRRVVGLSDDLVFFMTLDRASSRGFASSPWVVRARATRVLSERLARSQE